jgi:D-sedoheptulose 7-phosphate isomerase
MQTSMTDSFPALYKSDVLKAIETIDLDKVGQAIEILKEAREQGRHIFVCGNGGSASTASHFVCDMVKGASFHRDKRFRIMALTDSLPTITAYANDVCYDCVFVEQLKNFAEPGDVVMAISGSGNSPNVLRAVEWANRNGLKTFGCTGFSGGKLKSLAQQVFHVPLDDMGIVESIHLTAFHWVVDDLHRRISM